jgi:hypothetical protein
MEAFHRLAQLFAEDYTEIRLRRVEARGSSSAGNAAGQEASSISCINFHTDGRICAHNASAPQR